MWQTFSDYLWLCLTALLAGGINALAGGGTLLTFPALQEVLLNQHLPNAGVLANGTSTVALMPASVSSCWGFRREVYPLRNLLYLLAIPSVIGGALGAWLLVKFPERFDVLIPWLILTAAVLFTLQPMLSRRLARANAGAKINPSEDLITRHSLLRMIVLQFLIAIYGGYFGAGIGILMLSGLGLMGLTNMHQMNGLKAGLAAVINAVAIVVFIVNGNVQWSFAAAMTLTSVLGGFLAAHYSRRIDGRYVRAFVIVVGFALAVWYFLKT